MNKEEMTKEMGVEIATKYANDIWLFGEVDKECVSEVCKVLLSELDIANKKLEDVRTTVLIQKSIIKQQPSENKDIDDYFIARLDTILSIIGE